MTAAPQFTPQSTPAPDFVPVMDEALECALLGGLLIGAGTFQSVSHLTDDSFALPKNKRLWVTMQRLHARNIAINLETVRHELGPISAEGEKHLSALLSVAGTDVNSYSKLLQELEALRLLEANLHTSLKLARDRKQTLAQKSDQINSLVTDAMLKVSSVTGPDAYHVGQTTQNYHDTYLSQDVSGVGISTGFHGLDALMNGMEKRSVYLFGAGSGGGKSIMLQNLARHLNQAGHKGAILTLEMPEQTYILRGLACEMQVDMNRIKQLRLNQSELERMGEATQRINARGALMVIRLKMPTIAQLKAKITELTLAYGLSFVAIDYIAARHMTPGKDYKGDDVRFLNAIAQMMTEIAKDLNIILIPAAQVTQESIKRGGVPTIADFAGAAALVQESDVAIVLKDETPFNVSQGFGETRGYIVKSRTGGEGQFFQLESRKSFFSFESWKD